MSEAELVARLERLERDNQRLKRFGVVALVIAVAIGTMAATRPVPGVIKARTFEAVDTAGVTRVAVGGDLSGSPGLALYDRQGGPQLQISDFDSAGPAITMGNDGPLSGAGGMIRADVLISDPSSHQPRIVLQDGRGFVMELGSAPTKTAAGTSSRTPADSIVMFGNDGAHHVIWQAPN